MEDRLRECPFHTTHSDMEHHLYYSTMTSSMRCSCGASGPISASPESAKERWNTRATDLLMEEMARLLTRYLKETPLGHQPHMIAHEVEEALQKYLEGTCKK